MRGTISAYPNDLLRMLLLLATIFNFPLCNNNRSFSIACIEGERQALLSFKQDLVDDSNRLASWVKDDRGGNCCDWVGVVCSNSTGHIVELHLQHQGLSLLRGTMNPSLLNLKHLMLLDLSFNEFGGTQIPTFLASIGSLTYLDLSSSGFSGKVPTQFHNLTKLRHLCLGNNTLYDNNLHWLSGLSLLQFLDLSYTNLLIAFNWLQMVNTLPSLKFLYLDNCQLGQIPSLPLVNNLTSLSFLDLSFNDFDNSLIPEWIFCLRNLNSLSLSRNNFRGPLPDGLRNLTRLRDLHLSMNYFNSSIPSWFYSFGSGLEFLSLRKNNMQGLILTAIRNMTSLNTLDLSYNDFQIDDLQSFGHLCNLFYLDLSNIKLNQDVAIIFYAFSSCVSNRLMILDLSSTGIFGTLTNISFGHFKDLSVLMLRNNSISGAVPLSFGEVQSLEYVDLSSNNFQGQVPPFSSNLTALDLSKNSFIGSLSHFLCYKLNESKKMEILNLGDNLLSGEIPDCWTGWKSLVAIKMNNNILIGQIPISIGNLDLLQSLHIRNNSLTGEVPMSLRRCRNLVIIDLAENQLQGIISAWINKDMSNLTILDLRSNKFYGKVPGELCSLTALQILDLAHNNLSGSIPHCINKFNAMITLNNSVGSQSFGKIDLTVNGYPENALLELKKKVMEDALIVMKGKVMEYTTILNLVRVVDLSNNILSGKIPAEVTTLAALQSLNLSHNLFTGRIPQNIGVMRAIESLDLSMNKLSGEIPQSISSLTFLSHLNLSSNNLTGRIPSSTQLQSLNASSFVGNELCGPPLTKDCNASNKASTTSTALGDNKIHGEVEWFYVSMAVGFVVGFWGAVGFLLHSRQWRLRYFSLLGRTWDKLCDFSISIIGLVKRKFSS